MKKSYAFSVAVWLYPSATASWHFVTLPREVAEEIDFYFSVVKRGWGSLPVNVRVGKTEWKTSIFTDKQSGSYILPLKAEVRKRELIQAGDVVHLSLEVHD